MGTLQDRVIDILLAQHASEVPPDTSEERIIARNLHLVPKPETPSKVAKGGGRKPLPTNHRKGTSLNLVIPPVGSYNATGFILAMRQAGRRADDRGIPYTKQDEIHNDKIRAIAGYCGYDSRLPFGQQESAALMKAQRELKPASAGPSRSEQRQANRSMVGFVAGLPDETRRTLLNLQARERASAEAMIQHNKDSRDPSRSAEDRVVSMGLARVEGERLEQIRKDIEEMGFT